MYKRQVTNGAVAPYENKAKYLGMRLNTKLRWKKHVKKTLEELKIKFRPYKSLIGKHSSLSLYSETIIRQLYPPGFMEFNSGGARKIINQDNTNIQKQSFVDHGQCIIVC